MIEQTYDVVVIGAGAAGENVADRVAQAGLSDGSRLETDEILAAVGRTRARPGASGGRRDRRPRLGPSYLVNWRRRLTC